MKFILADDLDIEIENAGMILTRVGRTSNFRTQTTRALEKEFGDLMFDQHIKERSSVTEATATNKSIFEMSDKEAIKQFTNVYDQLFERLELS